MRPIDTPENNILSIANFAYIEDGMHTEVDFSFLPSGTRILSRPLDVASVPAPRRIVIASNNSELVIGLASEWLQTAGSAIEILWNPVSNPDFAYSLVGLSSEAPYSTFRQSNVTAHLILANAESNLLISSINRLTPPIARLLEESASENVSIPPKIFKQLTWRYTYLLNQIGELSEKVESLREKLKKSNKYYSSRQLISEEKSKIKELISTNEKLVEELGEKDKIISDLEARYHALAKSRLGALTLKYWTFRKKGK